MILQITRYSTQIPRYLKGQKSDQIPGYPGARYSTLETLLTAQYHIFNTKK